LHEAAAQGHACELAIVSSQLPGMDALELARTIKADQALASTRLILLTPQGQRGDAQAFEAAGYAAYLIAPADERQLRDCLTTVLALPAQAGGCGGRSGDGAGKSRLVTRHSLAEAKAQSIARILVAEDNLINQKVAARMLED
jgi:two-component system, sensor histidine kinase and response regulator